jgi:ankyrin repeat protein
MTTTTSTSNLFTTDDNIKLKRYYKKYSDESTLPTGNHSTNENGLQKNGSTLLHLAVINDDKNLVQKIMSISRQVNKKDITGQTCLHIAMLKDNISMAILLVQDSADIYIQDNQGRTALDMAKTMEIKQSLTHEQNDSYYIRMEENSVLPEFKQQFSWLRKVRDGQQHNLNLTTPLQQAVGQLINYNTVEQLINSGENIFVTDNNSGKTLLHIIGEIKYVDDEISHRIAKLLISNGVNINQQCKLGETPILSAVVCDNIVWLQWLLDNGADPNITDKWGNTPLHRAINFKCKDIVKTLLLSFAVDMSVKNAWGETVMDVAKSLFFGDGTDFENMLTEYNDEFILRSSQFKRAKITDDDDEEDENDS